MTEKQKEFLQDLLDSGFHISDGWGDHCSGYDEEDQKKEAIRLYEKWVATDKK